MSPTEDSNRMVVECQECEFEKTVEVDGESLPADVLRQHANETGHHLSVTPVTDD